MHQPLDGDLNGLLNSSLSNGHGQDTCTTGGVDLASTAGRLTPEPMSRSTVPIAICGMGMRLPGGIRDDEALYDFLINKKDARSSTPSNRYNADAYYSPHGKPGTIITKHGYFLNDTDLSKFDPSTFSITAAEAAQLDPSQRLVLEVVREALERAGESNWRGKKIGTYVGLFSEDWQDLHHKDVNFYDPYTLIGVLDFAIANRISYEYDLKGPSIMVKTACSSAGIGLHEAIQEIQRGSITSAIVAGANLIMSPGMTVAMSVQAALSPEGSSKSFDAEADGYARGEAVTVLYIKRLDEAIRDGNPIRAVIRASASNADGKTAGVTNPSAEAHEAAIREAYAIAGLDLSRTAMVETHGTGTLTGDPIEAKAIANCFGKDGVYMGAVKPNLGHSEGAATITIPWKEAKLAVPVDPCPWPADRAERLSVNSYGIGGSNVHFILDSAASFGLGVPQPAPPSTKTRKQKKTVLVFSAGHPESAKVMVKRHQEYLSKFPGFIWDANSWPIIQHFWPIYNRWIEFYKALSMHLCDVLCHSDDKRILSRAECAQPICTALQIALVDLLSCWGVRPSAVVGHSSGEIAASYAAECLTKEEAMAIAFYRGYACKNPPRRGGMAAVGLGRAEVSRFLAPGVNVACENSPSSVTLAGDLDMLEKIIDDIKEHDDEIFVRKLQVETAYHSDHMRLIGGAYCGLIREMIDPRSPKVPFYSSAEGGKVLSKAFQFGPSYWQHNLENPVLFYDAVRSMLSNCPQMALLEVGPHSTLRGALRQISQKISIPVQYISTLCRGENDTDSFLNAIGQLYTAGVHICVPTDPVHSVVLTDLPTYPWHYEREYWSETRVMKNWRFRKDLPHDLLGVRTLEGADLSPTWRNDLRIVNVPWLSEHCLGNDIVFPAAGYIAMAGEAAFQLSDGSKRDYSLKSMELKQALILHEDKPIELVTTLRPQRLTASTNSDWLEFQIVSFDGEKWMEHCFGLVRTGLASSRPSSSKNIPLALPRKVSSPRWYETMSRVGLKYGPRFSGLRDITASVTETKAVAAMFDNPGEQSESSYVLHPSTLDMAFQTWTVASVKGDYRSFRDLVMPTFIEEMYVCGGTKQKIHISATSNGGTVPQGHSCGIDENGELAFLLKRFTGSRLEPDETGQDLTALSLHWKPAFEFLNSGDLTRPIYDIREPLALLERLYLLCAVESNKALQGVTATQPHFERYRKWLSTQCGRFIQPGYILVDDSVDLVNMSSEKRVKLISTVFQQCENAGCGPIATAIWRTYNQVVNVFEGNTDFLDLLIHDGTLSAIYTWMNDVWDVSEFFQLLGHMHPQMKILEIGAGTGGLTGKVLEQLRSEFGERLYLQYTFTDVSSGFFPTAMERFKEYDAIEYKVLDISRNPLEQGFNREEYDLIIASNVLHATPFLHDTLVHVRSLLRPQGRLFLQELSPMINGIGYIMGLFSGWWLGEADGRIDYPFISPEQWDTRLRAAGFGGCETVTFDNERPYQVNANIIARPAVHFEYPTTITLLSGPARIHPLSLRVEALLRSRGYQTQHCQWGQKEQPPAGQDVISFVDLEQPFLKEPIEADWNRFLQLIQSLDQAAVVWLTSLAQVKSKDPHAALILGMARTIRSELAIPLATLELEHHDSAGAADAVVNVTKHVQKTKDDTSDLDPDMEFSWISGEVHVGRFHWFAVETALKEEAPPADTKALAIGKRGLLQSLHWCGRQLPELPADQVQIEMKAVGLNFKDVLVAIGIVDSGSGDAVLGVEGAGYVRKVGAGVNHIRVGDRVMTLGADSTGLATQVQRYGSCVVPIPSHLSFEDAATMPAVYTTVLLSLVDKARLEKGQSILIHSAAGGVGIAAIRVARWIGANIYCTVGSEKKATFLVEELGIPRDRIFHSRDISFRDNLMDATNGAGVDCVLNSLAGELLHASWECVASSGCLVEIGKRDMIGRGQLALDKFEDNRTYMGIDLTKYVAINKPGTARLMRLMVELCSEGHITPIHPITSFAVDEVEEAFRYMQQGIHIGKVVIKLPDTETSLPWTPETPTPSFRHDRAYLLVGGMGGLGQAIARWMTTHGAKHIIFLSRSAGTSEEDRSFIQELNLMGCKVQAWAGDVSDPAVVKNAIDEAPMPIAGVMQMAMVLHDVGALDMDLEAYQKVIRPRVKGTWNIHNALPNEELEFFVLFSSACGMVGYYGQANYAASNTFLDAFAQYRHNLGLPASVMDIGAVNDVGYISRTPAAKDGMLASAGHLITEQEFLDTLQLTIARSSKPPSSSPARPKAPGSRGIHFNNPSQVVQTLECRLPIMHPENNIIWKRDPRMAIYRNIETVSVQSQSTSSGLKSFLLDVNADPSLLSQPSAAEFLAGQIRDRVATFLMRREDDEPLDLGLSLSESGVDSLVAIEVRNWWKQSLGVEVSVLELKDSGSMLRLGGLAAKRLREKMADKPL
ncbi:hypothetical protein BDV38DRAFT_294724 [Aspergillus pseudotamarii]|uniref:Polyketide synthase n=1 Tax=Aspergillus pseudotamarii TaxID=132259 RepID=A0A5N6SKX5_ASPPS|nr:uncharacterized protein BDV38DRAFT_294724 [Aspergillus pseudotamarii]KAE8135205.1 hypothetical protein BDV38DRAFT_294724 [Aspergillus pseudotamarii]